jgi:thiamine-phosphate pyrophosphorylase
MHDLSTLPGIYVVTDAVLSPGRGHVEIAAAAAEGGAGWVQLRDKDLPDDEILEIARKIQIALAGKNSVFIVNDRVDIALRCGADGVHIGQGDARADAVRAKLGPDVVLGVSVATVEEALKAEADGADYVGLGPIFATATKSDAGEAVGIDMISQVRRAVGIPVVAIGGISSANIASVAAAGADSAAIISAVVCAPNMACAVRELQEEFDRGMAYRTAHFLSGGTRI